MFWHWFLTLTQKAAEKFLTVLHFKNTTGYSANPDIKSYIEISCEVMK